MEIAVFDTYVRKKEGGLMHFDILVPVDVGFDKILQYGTEYLNGKQQAGQPFSSNECKFCHIEEASEAVKSAIASKGYHIIEMQGC